jgi:uncharacterized protein (DUF169 family)
MSAAMQFSELLGLARQPVAVKFQDKPPPGVPRIDHAAPSGCTYWKYAAEQGTFYTEAPDHYGCPIGSYTHGIDLPEETAKELEGVVGMMVQLQYLDPKEVAGIPRRNKPFGVAVYAPLGDARFEPDVVLVAGNAKQMMLLAEAIHAAGIGTESSLMGRPTCAAIPAVMQSRGAATSLGCIGNRVYTGLEDDELYCAIAGSQLEAVAEKLATIVNANRELERFHLARLAPAD